MTLASDKQGRVLSARVELFIIDAQRQAGVTYALTPSSKTALTFAGQVFTPAPIQMVEVKQSMQGAPSTPKLLISNIDEELKAAINSVDLRMATVTRIETLAKYLDGEPDADPDQSFPAEIWRIERKVRVEGSEAEFELASVIDQEGQTLPRRRVMRTCSRQYRRYAPDHEAAEADGFVYPVHSFRCPYESAQYFTRLNQATNDPSLDVCPKTLTGCGLRFPSPMTLRHAGQPGATRG